MSLPKKNTATSGGSSLRANGAWPHHFFHKSGRRKLSILSLAKKDYFYSMFYKKSS